MRGGGQTFYCGCHYEKKKLKSSFTPAQSTFETPRNIFIFFCFNKKILQTLVKIIFRYKGGGDFSNLRLQKFVSIGLCTYS